MGPATDLYERIVDAANAIYGSHPGRRALHAKGTWCEGTFTASAEGASLSSAAALRGGPVRALVRFSNASGAPGSHDGARDGRGMAVKLRPADADEWDLLATMTPAFVARSPEDFLELMERRRPDRETGEPNMELIGEYLAAHPEAQSSIEGVLAVEPPASFATIPYYSPHAFRFVRDGGGTWARFRWRPLAGEHRLSDDAARERGRDGLRDELAERLAAGPAAFELELTLAGAGDPLDDPTAVWPAERPTLTAGRLDVERVVDDPEGGGHIEVFDPMRLPAGVEPSDDPILHARPHAYSVSAYRRLDGS